jgi:hypothetical protein
MTTNCLLSASVPLCVVSTANSITGLPGPGTMLLHGTVEWTKD